MQTALEYILTGLTDATPVTATGILGTLTPDANDPIETLVVEQDGTQVHSGLTGNITFTAGTDTVIASTVTTRAKLRRTFSATVDVAVANPASITAMVVGTETGGVLDVTLTATGDLTGSTVYWTLQSVGLEPPTAAQVVAGDGSDDSAALDSGSFTWGADTDINTLYEGDAVFCVTIDNGALSNVETATVSI